jgi:hypothetical protein
MFSSPEKGEGKLRSLIKIYDEDSNDKGTFMTIWNQN